MTGEMTLRGKVLPVGGIKDKVLGARRAGITTIILPRRNEKDLEDVPQAIKEQLSFCLVDRIDQVLELSLMDKADEGVDSRVWVGELEKSLGAPAEEGHLN